MYDNRLCIYNMCRLIQLLRTCIYSAKQCYCKRRLLGTCAYTSRMKKLHAPNNEYVPNNEISVYLFVHSREMFVHVL